MLASVVAHTALHTRSGHGSGFCRGGRGAERARGCGWGQQHADKGRGSCWRTTAPHRCEHRGGCVHAERAHLALIAGEGCDCGLLIHRHRAAAGHAQPQTQTGLSPEIIVTATPLSDVGEGTLPFPAQTTSDEEIEAAHRGVKVFSLPSVDHPQHGRHIELGVKGEPFEVDQAFALLLAGLHKFSARLGPELVRHQ